MRAALAIAMCLCAAPAWAQQTITCESVDGTLGHCPVDTRGGVVLQRQHSRAACIQNSTWGYDRRGIWVSNGCRASFYVADAPMSSSAKRNASIAAAAVIIGALIFATRDKSTSEDDTAKDGADSEAQHTEQIPDAR